MAQPSTGFIKVQIQSNAPQPVEVELKPKSLRLLGRIWHKVLTKLGFHDSVFELKGHFYPVQGVHDILHEAGISEYGLSVDQRDHFVQALLQSEGASPIEVHANKVKSLYRESQLSGNQGLASSRYAPFVKILQAIEAGQDTVQFSQDDIEQFNVAMKRLGLGFRGLGFREPTFKFLPNTDVSLKDLRDAWNENSWVIMRELLNKPDASDAIVGRALRSLGMFEIMRGFEKVPYDTKVKFPQFFHKIAEEEEVPQFFQWSQVVQDPPKDEEIQTLQKHYQELSQGSTQDAGLSPEDLNVTFRAYQHNKISENLFSPFLSLPKTKAQDILQQLKECLKVVPPDERNGNSHWPLRLFVDLMEIDSFLAAPKASS